MQKFTPSSNCFQFCIFVKILVWIVTDVPIIPTISAKVTFLDFQFTNDLREEDFKIPVEYLEDRGRFVWNVLLIFLSLSLLASSCTESSFVCRFPRLWPPSHLIMLDECPARMGDAGNLTCYCPHNMCARTFDGLSLSFLLGPSCATHCVLHLEEGREVQNSLQHESKDFVGVAHWRCKCELPGWNSIWLT